MKPRGKCFAKKCEDCRFWEDWDITIIKPGEETGLRTVEKKCSFEVLFKEIPRIKGAIDGLQSGVNEARNRSEEARDSSIEIQKVLSAIFSGIAAKRVGEGKAVGRKAIGGEANAG